MTDTVRDDQLDDKYIYNIETRYAGRITITVKEMLKGLPEYQKLLGFVKEIAKEKDEGCYESSAAGLSIIISRATDILEEIGELDG
jgi:hypothetical protein